MTRTLSAQLSDAAFARFRQELTQLEDFFSHYATKRETQNRTTTHYIWRTRGDKDYWKTKFSAKVRLYREESLYR